MPKGRFQNTRSAEPRFFLPPKKFGKRSNVFQILMPTAPTRIKPRLPARSTAERDSRGKYAKCKARPVKDTTGTRKLAKAGRRIYADQARRT